MINKKTGAALLISAMIAGAGLVGLSQTSDNDKNSTQDCVFKALLVGGVMLGMVISLASGCAHNQSQSDDVSLLAEKDNPALPSCVL